MPHAQRIIAPPAVFRRILPLVAAPLLLSGFACQDDSGAGRAGAAPGPQPPAAAPREAASAAPEHVLGAWQCMTRMQRSDEPMFTLALKPGGVWTDLTFGPAHRKDGRYTWSAGDSALSLRSANGSDLYTLVHTPAAGDEKERLIERVPEEDLYRAQVCYRYDGPLTE